MAMDNNKAPRSAADKLERVAAPENGPSMTQQQFVPEADINNITKKYLRGTAAFADPNATRQPMFGDFSDASDYQAKRNAIIDADMAFASLPAAVRRRFKDDPYQVIRFLDDPNNREEAIKLGLIVVPEAPKVQQEALPLKADPEANPGFQKPASAPAGTPPKAA